MISRREFVKIGAAVGAGVMLPAWMAKGAFAFNPTTQPAPANPLRLTKFIDTMPIMGLMPSAAPNYYRVGVYQFKSQAHSQMLPTTAWGYRPLGFVPSLTRPEPTWLAPSFAVPRGTPMKVEWINKLNGVKHPLPVDPSIMFADPLNNKPPMGTVYPVDANGLTTFDYSMNTVPIITHMHGGEQPPCADGGPFGWFTPGFAQVGPEWANSGDVDPAFAPTGKHNVYPYPNGQLPATIWYHDHALGLDRLNVYMGMAGACVIYDTALEPGFNIATPGVGLPTVLDSVLHPTFHDKFGQPYDIPLVIQDRVFDSKGQLWYPGRQGTNPDVHPFWVPEFFGDTICVNGKAWPKLNVEPRKYRFRVLDGSNARFYHLTLWNQTDSVDGPGITVVAGDQGYLTGPAVLAPGIGLTMGPGERMEVIIDFSAFAGKNVLLRNDAPSPWPDGDPVDPNTTGQIMMFQVDAAPVVDNSIIPATLNSVLGTSFPSIGPTAVPPVAPVITRQLTLNEVQGPGGPFQVVENFTALDLPTTETPTLGTTEIWRIVNMTVDGHPIHLHGSSFQILSRQPFLHETDPSLPGFAGSYDKVWAEAFGLGNDPTTGAPIIPLDPVGPPASVNAALVPSGYAYPGTVLGDGSTLIGGNPDVTPFLTGVATGPAPEEMGWKDTAKMLPGEVTEIIVRIAPNDNTPDFPYTATAPLGYVWHCHILEHEENDMMRRSQFMLP
jgi:spore coat protein A, manganese oxidase